jgi:hypothetical protein
LFIKRPAALVKYPAGRVGSYAVSNDITYLSDYAFQGCAGLTSVTVPSRITGIGNYAFQNCASLTNVNIDSSSITSIGDGAFQNCGALTGIEIPSTVGGIKPFAFQNCASLTNVYFFGNAPSPSTGMFDGATNAIILYLPGHSWSATFAGRPTVLWNPPYRLTINGGAGSGSYTSQQQVVISAVAGKSFVRWVGDTQYVANITSSPSVVTMPTVITFTTPTQEVALTATYNDVYALTVACGSGSGLYTNQQQVAIAASNAPSGKIFDRWSGATQCVASVTSSVTTVVMPAQAITVTATYKNIYLLTVNGGSGDGAYTNQQRVTITADTPLSGRTFDRWSGATQYVASVISSTTTVTMPAQTVTLTATYKNVYYTLTVNNGSGGGVYTNQQRVPIVAGTPMAGKTFSQWSGAASMYQAFLPRTLRLQCQHRTFL